VLQAAADRLVQAGFDPVDYVAFVDAINLEPLAAHGPGGRLIAAAWLGNVRLIDNLRVR
jgi:pantoate--beta-alanine ligase